MLKGGNDKFLKQHTLLIPNWASSKIQQLITGQVTVFTK